MKADWYVSTFAALLSASSTNLLYVRVVVYFGQTMLPLSTINISREYEMLMMFI